MAFPSRARRVTPEAVKGRKGDTGEAAKGQKDDTGVSVKGQKGDTGDSVKGQKGDTGESVKGQKGDTGEATKGQKGNPAKPPRARRVTPAKPPRARRATLANPPRVKRVTPELPSKAKKGDTGNSTKGQKGDKGDSIKGEPGPKGIPGTKGEAGVDASACKDEPEEISSCEDLCAAYPTPPTRKVWIIEDFDLPTGTMGEDIVLDGMDIAVTSPTEQCLLPMIFNTEHPTGNDCHLGTPSSKYHGPGCGTGGYAGSYRNKVKRGKCLIVSEDNNPNDPDDNRNGGTFKFWFCAPAKLLYVVLIDPRSGTTITQFDPEIDDYPAFPVPKIQQNGVYTRFFSHYAWPPLTRKLEIFMPKGGCVAEIGLKIPSIYDTCGWPEPPPVPPPHPRPVPDCHDECHGLYADEGPHSFRKRSLTANVTDIPAMMLRVHKTPERMEISRSSERWSKRKHKQRAHEDEEQRNRARELENHVIDGEGLFSFGVTVSAAVLFCALACLCVILFTLSRRRAIRTKHASSRGKKATTQPKKAAESVDKKFQTVKIDPVKGIKKLV